jgi:hypothetical protein
VLDNKVASVETLGVGVGLSVLQEVDEELGGLLGPASLADTELLACKALSANILSTSRHSKCHGPAFPQRHIYSHHNNSHNILSFTPDPVKIIHSLPQPQPDHMILHFKEI